MDSTDNKPQIIYVLGCFPHSLFLLISSKVVLEAAKAPNVNVLSVISNSSIFPLETSCGLK